MTLPLLDLAERPLPIAGRTPRARHASASGAEIAQRTRGTLQRRYLELLRDGPRADFEAEAALGCMRSSICSTRNSLVQAGYVEDAEEYVVNPASGARGERWRLTSRGEEALDA